MGFGVAAEYNATRAVCHSKYGFGGARQWAMQNGLTFRGQGHDWYYWVRQLWKFGHPGI